MHIKERKEMEDSFKKAQKPWGKLLAKVEKSKSDYHAACKTEKTATNQERNATADSSLSPDQVGCFVLPCIWDNLYIVCEMICYQFDYIKQKKPQDLNFKLETN